ncbi:hypothetical protein [Streptomyces millisiae]|uniref:Uncharacterized protein n=1 Tax=Streptomyces millisiae TaxID=3075542 RepID=A0ABU2LK11_9ACTN|nr:hypothetical protein [Streptomyces sp. DSM 44918]MDT0317918.1 hypothetical protein [Streptomyces sp. DSM 44918]
METLSKEEIFRKYADEELQKKILQLAALSDILGHSLIANSYKPSIRLNESFKLTKYGEEKLQSFVKKRVPYSEARLICLLELSWIDLLVDPTATSSEDVREAISREIVDRKIYFPFIFGRFLYDRAFEKLDLEDGVMSLNLSETLEFLDDTPQGVFQYRDYVTGPYGLLTSQEPRFFPPERGAPLMHCSDVDCAAVHRVGFATGAEAAINKHRSEAVKVLAKDSDNPSAWGSFLSDLFVRDLKPARDQVGDTLIPILGDCLTDAEIRSLSAWLLDNTQGRLRSTAESVALRGRASDIVAGLGRAEMMQLCLTLGDRDLTNGLDALIYSGDIKVPPGEVRRPKVVVENGIGEFQLHAELGPSGVRIRSHSVNLAPLRLRRLVESMYRLDDVIDREELDWQLRGENGPSLEARLESYLQKRSPETVIKTLSVVRKSNAVTACEVLGLREGAIEDPQFVSLILWKLGFGTHIDDDLHADFWRHHEKLEQLTRAALGAPQPPPVDDFRGAAANYFVALETLLRDSLCYSIWALTVDHYVARQPFIYRPEVDSAFAFSWLQDVVDRSGDSTLNYGEKVTLHALMRGYQCLGAELERMSAEPDRWLRSGDIVPSWAAQQNLQKFVFWHTVPFLDLTSESRMTILRQLQEISRVLVSEKVYDDRNSWMHGGREIPDPTRVRKVLAAVKDVVQMIEDSGFARVKFATSSQKADGYGRSVTTLLNAKSMSIEVRNPTQFDWLGLPSTSRSLHVMSAACFAAPDHYLRFRSEVQSPFADLWANFPRRKPRSQRSTRALEGLRPMESGGEDA